MITEQISNLIPLPNKCTCKSGKSKMSASPCPCPEGGTNLLARAKRSFARALVRHGDASPSVSASPKAMRCRCIDLQPMHQRWKGYKSEICSAKLRSQASVQISDLFGKATKSSFCANLGFAMLLARTNLWFVRGTNQRFVRALVRQTNTSDMHAYALVLNY